MVVVSFWPCQMAVGQPRKISLFSTPGALIAHFVAASPISQVRAVKKGISLKRLGGLSTVGQLPTDCHSSQSGTHRPSGSAWPTKSCFSRWPCAYSRVALLLATALFVIQKTLAAWSCDERTSVVCSVVCVCVSSRVASQKVRSIRGQSFLRPSARPSQQQLMVTSEN